MSSFNTIVPLPRRTARLVHVPLQDAPEFLTAAWYEPARRTSVALLHLHGKGGNFYTGTGLFIPQEDGAAEFAHLSLNMRCHDLGYTRYDVYIPDVSEGVIQVAGGMWERMTEGPLDTLSAIRWLAEHGYDKIIVVGHSTGAYYAAQVAADHKQEATGLAGVVLLSTVISSKRHLNTWFPGRLEEAVAQANRYVAEGKGHMLLPTAIWYYAISAASLLERVAERDGEFPRMLAAIDVPVMFVCGEREPRVAAWRQLYDAMGSDVKAWKVLPGVSHDYGGQEAQLAQSIAAFAQEYT